MYSVAGIDARHKAWQAAGLATEAALLLLLPVCLRAWRRDERWTALYALSPLPAFEVVNNGHVDGLVALLAVGALVVLGRATGAVAPRRAALAGAMLGAGALVKLYPVLLIAALVGAGARRRRPAVLAAGAACAGAAAVAVVGYLPHLLSVGARVLGYLPGYLREEDYASGGRFLLLGLVGLRGDLAAAAAVLALGAAVAVVVVRGVEPARGFAILMGALLLVTTPVQPWYAVMLLAVAAAAGEPRWAVLSIAGYPYFFAVILDAPHAVAIGRVSYLAGLAAFAAAAWDMRTSRNVRRMPARTEEPVGPFPPGADPVEYDKLRRRALWKMPSGLYIVGARSGDRRNGMTLNWATQVSVDPKLLAISVEQAAFTHELISESGVFSLNLVDREDRAIVRKFTKPVEVDAAARTMNGFPYHDGRTGAPILDQAVAYLDCEVRQTVDVGHYSLFIGEIVDAAFQKGEETEVLRMEDTRMNYGG